ncbi:hypothetical protein [Streptomyces chrestomyceticus]|uniref:hypothetical protein n=1 Tax=Streptomyces chrestomyceticus TaxID=68185 RepID=UPI0033D13501
MTSQRNNRLQEQQRKLKEQQKQELKALTSFVKALEAEQKARVATAAIVADAVAEFGAPQAARIFDLESKEVTAYVKDAEEAREGGTAAAVSDDASESTSGDSATASSIPGQASEQTGVTA